MAEMLETMRTALVTGASSGIGQALARALVAQGKAVAMVGRRHDVLSAQAQAWAAAGLPGLAVPVAADLSDPAAVAQAVRTAEAAIGRVELLINSAGIYYTGPVAQMPLAQFTEMMNVNYLAAVAMVRAVLPGMQAARRGAIVNVSSLAGKIPAAQVAGYGASKFALACFTAALRSEADPYGIRVLGVYPGPVETPMIRERAGKGPAYRVRMLPIVTPEAVARATLAGIRRNASELYLPGLAAILGRVSPALPTLSARLSHIFLKEL